MHRRDFLAASAAGASLALSARDASGFLAEQKPRVGVIGTGWYGKCDLFRLLQVAPVDVVSLCDVDRHMLEDAGKQVAERQTSKQTPRLFGDYREMLKARDLDIVIVGTPDHQHALPTIAAMEAGADIYVQKPVSVDVLEGKAMLSAARRLGRVVQVGTQRRSTPHLVEARDRVIRGGKLGKIGHVEVCCYYHMRADGNPPVTAVPEYFDYDAWTGPAPLRPFDGMPHKRWWRTFMEYSNGIMGDMCVHMLDTARWMLELGWPKTVSSAGGILVQKGGKSNIADTQSALFDFGDLQVSWQHRTYGSSPDPDYPWAVIFYGDKGTLKASVNKYEFFPSGKNKPTLSGTPLMESDKYPEDKNEKDLEQHVASAIRAHLADFLAARANRGRPVADIEQGHISTASCILANLSMQLGRSLKWDAERHQVVGDEEATKLLRRPYRSGYTHPEPA